MSDTINLIQLTLTMPSGRFQGKPLADLPAEYLQWAFWFNFAELDFAYYEELSRRGVVDQKTRSLMKQRVVK